MTKRLWEPVQPKCMYPRGADKHREGLKTHLPADLQKKSAIFHGRFRLESNWLPSGHQVSREKPVWGGQTQQGVTEQKHLSAAKQTDTTASGQIHEEPESNEPLETTAGKQKHLPPNAILGYCSHFQ